MIRRLLSMLVVLGAPGLAGAQTSIELHSSAKVVVGAPITLADIARVAGEDADALGATIIEEEAPDKPTDIDVTTVRARLDATKLVRWGKTTLRGSVCTVIPTGVQPSASRAKKETRQEAPRHAPVRLDGPETVRTHVVRAVARMYNAGIEDLRFLFEDRDKELLDMSTAGRRVDVQPTNSPASARTGLRIYVFSGDRLAAQRTISVDVLIRRSVVTAVTPLPKGHEIRSEDITISEQWHAPSAAVPCTPEQAIGSVTRSRVAAGQLLTTASVEAPVVVKKGDIVEVHCLSGAIHLKATRARAMESGRDGELVEFQLEGSKRTFKARMSGRGSAVLVIDAMSEVRAEETR